MINRLKKYKFSFFIFVFILFSPYIVFAVSEGEINKFNIDKNYDLYGREDIDAQLIRITPNLYFYIEKNWWDSISPKEKNNIRISLFNLGEEFRNKIYPVLTSTFGSEPKPGIDKDERITILFHQMDKDYGGYSNTSDFYLRFQAPRSNQREMIYLNTKHLLSPFLKNILAHEFMHLITMNQKNLLRNVDEEVWFNEARSEYTSTLLGYNDIYEGSHLQARVRDFLENPSVSLTQWQDKKENYGAVGLFVHYLVDHYGIEILIDSLHSSKVGILSLEEVLKKRGFQKDFSQIFSDWVIALLINNCDLGNQYCYLNKNLKDLRVIPSFYYIPSSPTILSAYHNTSYWQPKWQKLVGGGNELSLEFKGAELAEFNVPYLLCKTDNNCIVSFLSLDEKQRSRISFFGFNTQYKSLTLIPYVKSKVSELDEDSEIKDFSFSWKVSVNEKYQSQDELKNQLLKRISELQEQVRQLQAQLNAILNKQNKNLTSCYPFTKDLFFGMRQSKEVSCLQEFLKSQGAEIYPEGLITGNFLYATRQAVIRFQEKYASEILTPLGLKKGTGYVGSLTKAKINQIVK